MKVIDTLKSTINEAKTPQLSIRDNSWYFMVICGATPPSLKSVTQINP